MSVGREPLENYRYSAGVGYICLVSDLGREEYINTCFRTNTVSVKFDDGSTSHRVPIDTTVLNFIDFPLLLEQNGTPVFWVNEPLTGNPIVIGRTFPNDEMSGLVEGQFKFSKKTDNGSVELSGSSIGGYLNLTVDGENVSNINLIVHNKNNAGNINLSVQGDCTIQSSDTVAITGNNQVIISGTNAEGNGSRMTVDNEQITLDTQTLIVGEGTEPMILGLSTINFLGKFIDTLYNSTVTTQLGQMPLMNKEDIKKLKDDLQALLSEGSFLD